jgi:hypothetical protein
MSGFKTIKQQSAESAIEKMFEGLPDDIALKTVMRVLHGLDDESVLDELRRVNEENLREIESRMTITDANTPDEGKIISTDDLEEKTTDIINAEAANTSDN